MHFAKRPDGTIPNQHDVDSALHEILGVQECHTLHSLRKVRQTWTVALNATGLPAAKITFLWDHMLDAVRPTWLADEMANNSYLIGPDTRVPWFEFVNIDDGEHRRHFVNTNF